MEPNASQPPATNIMPRVFAWGALMVVLAGVIGYALAPSVEQLRSGQVRGPQRLMGATTQPAEGYTLARDLPVMFRLPDFSFVERSGETVTQRELTGRVWIADFVFTNCAGPCPLMTRKMAALSGQLADAERVQFVTFSVDPQRDTPEVLREYAKQHGADAQRWWFLTTGEPEAVRRLAIEGFRIIARPTTSEERQQGMDDILHSTYFVLVDAVGRVRGFYDSLDEERVEKLIADTRALYRAGGR